MDPSRARTGPPGPWQQQQPHWQHAQRQQQQKALSTTTLVIKYIPSSLTSSPDTLRSYFMQYGATGVRPMTGKNMRGMAFVDFGDAAAAQTAFQQLDRLVINDLHKGLKVEYALQKGSAASSSSSSNQQHQNTPAKNKEPAPRTMAPSETPGTPIAPELGVSYASNPQLIYRYPDPTPEIIHNMANAIATVPRLYIQVLHLMNKMNLPPPFDDLPASAEPGILKRARDDLVASDESELESDDDYQKREDQQRTKLRRMTVQEQRQAMQKRA